MIDLKRILVPLDGSLLAERALPLATTLAQKHQSQLILLRAWRLLYPAHRVYRAYDYYREVELYAYQEAKTYLQAQQDDLRKQGFDVQTFLSDAFPIEAIVAAALTEDVDLIIMATHGRRGLARWLLGSVADEVAHLAACPVLLVRQNKEYNSPRRGKPILSDWFGQQFKTQPCFRDEETLVPEPARAF
jgi:nucleotide-binding universal stress UspA family protein